MSVKSWLRLLNLLDLIMIGYRRLVCVCGILTTLELDVIFCRARFCGQESRLKKLHWYTVIFYPSLTNNLNCCRLKTITFSLLTVIFDFSDLNFLWFSLLWHLIITPIISVVSATDCFDNMARAKYHNTVWWTFRQLTWIFMIWHEPCSNTIKNDNLYSNLNKRIIISNKIDNEPEIYYLVCLFSTFSKFNLYKYRN